MTPRRSLVRRREIVMLDRGDAGILNAKPVDTIKSKPKTFCADRRQFAAHSRTVRVVEGSSEAWLFPVASSVMEKRFGAKT